jgi:Ni,Fe-hydrogenase III small subunit
MYKTLRMIAASGLVSEPMPLADEAMRLHAHLQGKLLDVLGRALCIRHVDAGSCNACELEIHALNNPVYNLEGAGIRFVASPRHADLLLVTGPVTRNMEVALRRTWEATPGPKLVVGVGGCAAGCGIFGNGPEIVGPVSAVIPVDVLVPGCPPAPLAILQGIVTAVSSRRASA